MAQNDSPPATADKPRRGRPRGAPDASESRQKLIRAGLESLTERGYSAVGVDEILKAAGVPKGSFYHHFAGKADFGLALVAAYNAYFLDLLDRAFLDEGHKPLDRLRHFTAKAEDGMARHGFRRGCLVGNLGQEMGALPDDFRDALTGVLDDWQIRTARLLRAAQAQGQLSSDHDPEALAEVFWIGWEGAVLRAKLELRPEPLRRFADTFFRLIQR
ncbi:TetR/AcrR family transcriptional regulator [Salipiger mangrovisoli]|uniref:TetR/AcrR family transcriptional regulator n=1 Tax=Salipiger mangrovisoli TaxID=2865933 RepID=A0ABR9X216_9RHOB|nr:TetR/AcrR family transcriptional regulator [Salipiger mangrovisoli]MBE9637520.1 TetR/AcrR family transcriptional regulator [Salipiger mangrovisoli]